ncbi:hypothetical protein QBC40DRAFT_1098 [Triangularia verruculosa]|uniref:Uncharacterized protein n=1 Tax=Triangularia verruculosa TaxID=2587418 RepID=A0AAN6XSD0_9PEZI|nr:hypothetical protein QBC40DRAFT_1098 [Triangularia verruculosa]
MCGQQLDRRPEPQLYGFYNYIEYQKFSCGWYGSLCSVLELLTERLEHTFCACQIARSQPRSLQTQPCVRYLRPITATSFDFWTGPRTSRLWPVNLSLSGDRAWPISGRGRPPTFRCQVDLLHLQMQISFFSFWWLVGRPGASPLVPSAWSDPRQLPLSHITAGACSRAVEERKCGGRASSAHLFMLARICLPSWPGNQNTFNQCRLRNPHRSNQEQS